MYLIYVDESGKPSKKHHSPLFIQAAIIILDDDWQSVDNLVNTLKAKWFPNLDPEDFEFHAYQIAHQLGLYKTLGSEKSLELLNEICELIAQIDCTLISSVIHKDRLRKIKTRDEIELWCHRFLFERVCKYLEKENDRRINANETTQNAILLIDSINPKYNNTVRKKYNGFFHYGTHFEENKYLIENPLFVDSQYRSMSQLVDVVAYLVHRKIILEKRGKEIQNPIDQYLMKGFQTIFPKFDTDSKGNVDGCGIKQFPKDEK